MIANRAVNLRLNTANHFSTHKVDSHFSDDEDEEDEDELRSCLKPPLGRKTPSIPLHEMGMLRVNRVDKKVRISRVSQIFFIDTDYSDDEWRLSFWSNEEFEDSVEKCRTLGKTLPYNSENMRGIERFSERGRRERRMNYFNAIRVVLIEKEALWDICNSKEKVSEALAENYSDYTVSTANAAFRRGIADERVARKIHTEDIFERNAVDKMSMSLAWGYKPRRMSM